MEQAFTSDLCIIGAGSGGLTLASVASQLGVRTVLIEQGRMGGDCLNYGCVPSKALIAAARVAHTARTGAKFGVDAEPRVDFARVHRHVQDVIASIAVHDSIERFTALGVRVMSGHARFTDPRTVAVGDTTVRSRRFVIATGSQAAVPPTPGLAKAGYLTNESVFDLTSLPGHLVVIGAGPIGLELGQAFRRLGAQVTLIEAARALAAEDPELSEPVIKALAREGVTIIEDATVARVTGVAGRLTVTVNVGSSFKAIEATHILVAVGRKPNLDLGLDAGGIAHTPAGITVNAALRTSNRRIFAIGDAASRLKFTHVANYHAIGVLKNVLLPFALSIGHQPVPWVTYTDPELAHVGLKESEAREQVGPVDILRWPFAENDRARADRAMVGHIKVVTDKRRRVLGASIVGPHAGELIRPWVTAVADRQRIGRMVRTIYPYPTYSEVSRRAAASAFSATLANPRLHALVRFLLRFG